jgi:signal transduction histidine kinase
MKINPITTGLNIDKITIKQEFFTGEEITMIVKAKNIGQKTIIANLKEEIPHPLEVISGLTEKTLTMNSGDEEEFYTYKLRVPLETEEGIYSIKTILESEELSKVEELNLTIRANETLIEKEVIEEIVEEVVEEKKGFFRSIMDFLLKIFG